MTATETKRIYLAGPMRGLPNYNRVQFVDAREVLIDWGHKVHSPSDKDVEMRERVELGDVGRWDMFQAVRWNMAMILYESDVVAVLPNWETSEGTQQEILTAQMVGLPIWFLEVDDNGKWYCWSKDEEKVSLRPVQAAIEHKPPKTETEDNHGEQYECILDHAKVLVNGARNETYGHATKNFENIAIMWTVMLDHKLKTGEVVTPGEVGRLMICQKLCRLIVTPDHYDSHVDVGGYDDRSWECEKHAKDNEMFSRFAEFFRHTHRKQLMTDDNA